MYLLTKRLSGEYGECRINSTDFLCHFLFNDGASDFTLAIVKQK